MYSQMYDTWLMTKLPDILDTLAVNKITTPPNDALTFRAWSTDARSEDFLLDLADRRRCRYLDNKGMRISWKFDTKFKEGHDSESLE